MKSKQFLVIGAGRFGSALASTLYELGHEVVVIDSDEEAVEDIMNRVTHAVIGDATDEDALRRLGCSNFDTVVVAIGENLEANILATVAAKTIGSRKVISKAKDDLAARVLERVGADMVIRPEHDMGVRLAKQMSTPNVLDALSLDDLHGIVEIEIHSRLVGPLEELRLPKRFGVQVIAVSRDGKIMVSPGADFVLRRGDKVLLLGENEAIEQLRSYVSD